MFSDVDIRAMKFRVSAWLCSFFVIGALAVPAKAENGVVVFAAMLTAPIGEIFVTAGIAQFGDNLACFGFLAVIENAQLRPGFVNGKLTGAGAEKLIFDQTGNAAVLQAFLQPGNGWQGGC